MCSFMHESVQGTAQQPALHMARADMQHASCCCTRQSSRVASTAAHWRQVKDAHSSAPQTYQEALQQHLPAKWLLHSSQQLGGHEGHAAQLSGRDAGSLHGGEGGGAAGAQLAGAQGCPAAGGQAGEACVSGATALHSFYGSTGMAHVCIDWCSGQSGAWLGHCSCALLIA
jgi:hypothetical protein